MHRQDPTGEFPVDKEEWTNNEWDQGGTYGWDHVGPDGWAEAASVDSLCVKIKVEEEQDKEVSVQDDLVNDLNNMLISSDTADAHLVCLGKKFPCHRSLLAARSSVFKTMFFGLGDYKEGKTRKVTIKEFQPDEIEQFLSFVYTGDCDFSKVDTWQILALADKYDVPVLRRICCKVNLIRICLNPISLFYHASLIVRC